MLAVYIIVTIIGWVGLEYNPMRLKEFPPFLRFAQSFTFVLISLMAYFTGKFAAKRLSFARFAGVMLVAFIPSLVVGLIQGLTVNGEFITKLSHVMTAADLPVGYYRAYLMTLEASWAGFDVVVFVMPLTLYFYFQKPGPLFLGLFIVELLVLYFINSSGSFLLAAVLIALFIIFSKKSAKTYLALLLMMLLGVGWATFQPIMFERLINVGQSLAVSDTIEESGATRIISQQASIEVFKENPLIGVGLRNFGYYYPLYIPDVYLKMPLFSEYADPKERVMDVKSYFLDMLAATGLIGILFTGVFYARLANGLKQIRARFPYEHRYIVIILLTALAGGLSITLLGYPAYWIFLGYIAAFSQRSDSSCYQKAKEAS